MAESLSRSSVQIKQDDSATQALGYVERKRDEKQQETQITGNKKRRILLDSYRDVKLSDLNRAKEILREGTKQPEKEHEGKEI